MEQTKEILAPATWIDPRVIIMFSEMHQSQKDKYCVIPLT